jgi:hypothetical protein
MEKESTPTEQAPRGVRYRKVIRRLLLVPGCIFLLVTLCIVVLFSRWPALQDALYTYGLFRLLRSLMDVAGTPMVVALLITLMTITMLRCIRRGNRMWSAICIWFASFFWLFGFHYTAPAVLPENNNSRVPTWKPFLAQVVDSVNAASWQRDTFYERRLTADDLRNAACGVLLQFRKPCSGRPQVYPVSRTAAWLSRCGISGVYVPWLFAGIYDASYPPVATTFTLAHELGHAYGIAPEQEADMFAFYVLCASGFPEAKYSAYLALYRAVRYQVKVTDPTAADSCEALLANAVRDDLKMLRAHAELYPEFFPGVQEGVNHAYLKSMGQAGGVYSYDLFPAYVYTEWCPM